MQLDLVQVLLAISNWLDWSYKGITNHHRQVAFAAMNVGKAVGLSEPELSRLFKAAIIHDIGAVTWDEKDSLSYFEVENTLPHCARGSQFISRSAILSHLSDIILHHHDKWKGLNPEGASGDQIPLSSRIIHLCDRLVILMRPDDHILNQRRQIMARISSSSGRIFDPGLVDVMADISHSVSFWLDIANPSVVLELPSMVPSEQIVGTADDLYELAEVMAFAVDAKSRFTYQHSHGVAAITRFLADSMGLDGETARLLETAGLLHDLGKLTVPESILEKPGPLTPEEVSWIKQHPYYTYWFMVPVGMPPELPGWAGYHHERLDGRGYPFGKTSHDLGLEHRIVAVADIFTALKEDRPYRPSLGWNEIADILSDQVRSGGIDGDIVSVILDNREAIDALWADLSASAHPGVISHT